MDGGNADFAGAKICLTRPTLMHKKKPPLGRFCMHGGEG